MRRRVLIAHPDETILAALAGLVGSCDRAELVGQAGTPDLLEELAARTEPDVVVTGLPVWRPEVSDAVRRLKRSRPGCYVLATTDRALGPYLALAMTSGADEVLTDLDCGDRLRAVLAGDLRP